MKKVIEILQEELSAAFEKAGYDKKYAKVGVSNRPDLCQYQCNGALAAAKEYHKAPIQMANEVVEFLKDSESFKEIAAQAPGFINMSVSDRFLADYINKMAASETLGLDKAENPETIVIDYGGANVAKPLHVGHLRSAVIGESIKRTARYLGHKVIGDVHLGDWGLQIGLIITELKHRKPELVYFDESFILQSLHLQCLTSRRYILMHQVIQKSIRSIKRKHRQQQPNSSREEKVILHSGSTLSMCLLQI